MLLLILIQPAYNLTRNTGGDTVIRYIAVNDTTGADYAVISDFHTGKYRCPAPDEAIIPYLYLTINNGLFLFRFLKTLVPASCVTNATSNETVVLSPIVIR